MQVTVKIGGNEAVVTVASADEAADLLAKLSRRLGGPAGDGLCVAAGVSADASDHRQDEADSQNDRDAVFEALRRLKGNPAAVILKIIASHTEGCDDAALKSKLSAAEIKDSGLGPAFAHISKCCKKCGIDPTALYTKKTRRGRKGKLAYFYRVTDTASRLISEIQDFDKEPTWDGLEPFGLTD